MLAREWRGRGPRVRPVDSRLGQRPGCVHCARWLSDHHARSAALFAWALLCHAYRAVVRGQRSEVVATRRDRAIGALSVLAVTVKVKANWANTLPSSLA